MDGSAWSSFHSSLLEHGMRPNRQLGERRAEATMVSQLEGDSRAVHWEKLSRRAIFPNVLRLGAGGKSTPND